MERNEMTLTNIYGQSEEEDEGARVLREEGSAATAKRALLARAAEEEDEGARVLSEEESAAAATRAMLPRPV